MKLFYIGYDDDTRNNLQEEKFQVKQEVVMAAH
jgi:hypothetical protein